MPPKKKPDIADRMTRPVDGYIRKQAKWTDVLTELRRVVLEAGLTETVKWRVPCYMHDGDNVVLLNALKGYAALAFMQGSLLTDPKGILEAPGENTRAARMVKFTDAAQVTKLEPTLRKYLAEAMKLRAAGAKVDFEKDAAVPIPDELTAAFADHAGLEAAFDALTPGRRRAYLLHFNGAKQSKTRTARIEKHVPLIMAGKGMDDDYKAKMKRRPKKSG